MTQTPPPYSNISGLYVQVNKHVNTTLANYEGNGRPGQLVVDTANYQLYISNANGNLNIVSGSGGSYSNANVAAFLPTYSGNIGTDGTTSVNFINAVNASFPGTVSIGSQNGNLRMLDNGSGASITICAPIGSGPPVRWLWPNSNGIAGQYLQTDGTGVTSWQTVSGGTSLTNGNSNIVVSANGNISAGVAGTANVLIVTATNANVSGGLNVTQGVLANTLVSNANTTVNGNLRASNGVIFSNLTQFTTSSSNANIVMFDLNGNVSYNSTLFYNNGDNELHVGNLVINDNPVGTEIKTIQPIVDGGYLQFSAGGNTPFTVKPTGSVKLSYAPTTPSGIPPNGLGDMYFNNDAGNGTQGFYVSKTSSANGWDKIMTASNVGGIVQLPAQTAAPTAVEGGIYYNTTTKQFLMCANTALGWQVVNLT